MHPARHLGFLQRLVLLFTLSFSLAPVLAVHAAETPAAPPEIPAGFYGTVKRSGANVAVGLTVTAWIGGVQYGQSTTLLDSGQSYYNLIQIPGDDNATPGVKEGGIPGDVVTFKVEGEVTTPTAIWASGVNQVNITLPPLTPVVTSVAPTSGYAGTVVQLSVSGENSHFVQGQSSVTLGSGITAADITVQSSTALTAELTIAANAAPGARTLVVTTGSEVITLTSAFVVQTTSLAVSLPSGVTGANGAQVVFPLVTSADLAGHSVLSYEFTVLYDPQVLVPVGVSQIGTLTPNTGDWNVVTHIPASGQLNVVAYGASPLSGSGTLLKLLFNVTGSANAFSQLGFGTFLFNDGQPATTTDGTFTVSANSISGAVHYVLSSRPVDDVQLALSGEASHNVATSNGLFAFANLPFGDFTLTPSMTPSTDGAVSAYDASLIARCVAGSLDNANCPLERADTDGNGTLHAFDAALIARYLLGLTNNPSSDTGFWRFSPSSYSYTGLNASQENQDFTVHILGDVDASWGEAIGAANASLGVEQSVTGNQLTVQGAADKTDGDLYAFEFELAFDNSELQLTDVTAAGKLPSSWQLGYQETKPGSAKIVAYGATPLTSGTPLFEATFTLLAPVEPGAPTVALNDLLFNDQSAPVNGLQQSSGIYLPIVAD